MRPCRVAKGEAGGPEDGESEEPHEPFPLDQAIIGDGPSLDPARVPQGDGMRDLPIGNAATRLNQIDDGAKLADVDVICLVSEVGELRAVEALGERSVQFMRMHEKVGIDITDSQWGTVAVLKSRNRQGALIERAPQHLIFRDRLRPDHHPESFELEVVMGDIGEDASIAKDSLQVDFDLVQVFARKIDYRRDMHAPLQDILVVIQ